MRQKIQKLSVTILSIILSFLLIACSNPEETAETFVEDFTTQYESNEVIFTEEKYTEDNLEKSFTEEYFSKEFLRNVLPVKLSNLSFYLEEDVLTLPEHIKFLRVSRDNTADWVLYEIDNIKMNEEENQANVNLKSQGSYLRIELIKENNDWKINTIE